MKIQKVSTAIILLALFASAFQGCKKGENDPFLSFRSRDARLAGDWDLSAMSDVSTTTNTNPASTSVTTTTYSSGTQTTISGSNPPFTTISKYNLSLKIDKNGEFSYILEGFDTQGASTGTTEEKGFWVWGSTAKRKSSIIISVGGPLGPVLEGTWKVDQLKNKEIIFKQNSFKKSVNTNNTSETTGEVTMTFTGK